MNKGNLQIQSKNLSQQSKDSINATSNPRGDAMCTDKVSSGLKNNHPQEISIWTIGSTDVDAVKTSLVQELTRSQSSSDIPDDIEENNHSKNSTSTNTHTSQYHHLPTLSSLSNMGTEGVQSNPNFSEAGKSVYQDRLLNAPNTSIELVLASICGAIRFDIAEVWLRTGPKTHQLISSHLRPAALENSIRSELVDIYYGERSSERTHRLSPFLCKRAKEAKDVVWVTTQTESGAETLRVSISDVRTAVAVPVCHKSSDTNITFIYFSMKRTIVNSAAVEFFAHMSISAAITSVNPLSEEIFVQEKSESRPDSHSLFFEDFQNTREMFGHRCRLESKLESIE